MRILHPPPERNTKIGGAAVAPTRRATDARCAAGLAPACSRLLLKRRRFTDGSPIGRPFIDSHADLGT